MSVLNKVIKIERLVNHTVAMQPDTIRFMSNKTLTKVIDYTKIISGGLRFPDSQISNNKILYFTPFLKGYATELFVFQNGCCLNIHGNLLFK